MTLAESSTHAPAVQECLHDSRAVCWLCSDQDPRWREWRGGGDPPNARPAPARLAQRTMSAEEEREWLNSLPAKPLPVLDKQELSTLEGWRGWYQRTFGKRQKG